MSYILAMRPTSRTTLYFLFIEYFLYCHPICRGKYMSKIDKLIYNKQFATFSQDKKHRFSLFRCWDIVRPCAMVIGLNPSTANDEEDDRTIGFVTRILNNNNYGGLFMVNLYTMITPYPKDLVRDDNREHAIKIWQVSMEYCTDAVFAWGRFKIHDGRDEQAKIMYPNALCFGHLMHGEPHHPMYLPNNTKLIRYR